MKRKLLGITGAALAAGMMFAQAPPPSGGAQPQGQHRQWKRGQGFSRLSTKLNLTDAQKEQAKSIFDAARESSKPVAQELRQQRQALQEAAKAGKTDAEIDQLANQVGSLTGQMTAVRTKAFAKFYALLTPEQRTQAQQMRHHRRGAGHEEGDGA
jgi:Spy/CpxP family protein refolding chaperone